MITEEIPLFPLRAVLLPGGRIPLQIFEPRYLDLVSRCMKGDAGFGIVHITEGHEVIIAQGTTPPVTAEVGTLARIVDWDALPAGRLRITVEGSRRFRVHATRAQPDGLLWGTVDWLPETAGTPLALEHEFLQDIMRGLAEHPALARLGVSGAWDDTVSLAWVLAQYLPLDESERYAVLVEPQPLARLERIDRVVRELGSS
jgi:uncharacterized protein